MTRLLVLALLALALVGCDSDGPGAGATPLESAVVIMGERISDPTDGSEPTIEQYPVCMGCAVGPELVLTSDHCPIGSIDDAFVVVTYDMWETTASGNVLADMVRVRGEVRELRPRVPLDAWISGSTAAGPGPAEVVVLRSTNIVALPVLLDGDMFGGMVPHGDSGACLFQARKLVGLVQACNSTNDTDCDLDGGRFSGP